MAHRIMAEKLVDRYGDKALDRATGQLKTAVQELLDERKKESVLDTANPPKRAG